MPISDWFLPRGLSLWGSAIYGSVLLRFDGLFAGISPDLALLTLGNVAFLWLQERTEVSVRGLTVSLKLEAVI